MYPNGSPYPKNKSHAEASATDQTDGLRFVEASPAEALQNLIGLDTMSRPWESWYAFVSRLIRANLFNDAEVRSQLPTPWVRWAFAPHQLPLSEVEAPEALSRLPDLELKFRALAWHPFPELSSVPPECLRICPSCAGMGTHSYAMQADVLERCPVHDEPLVHRCPNCNVPLLWQARTSSQSAFCCPAGCSLHRGPHSGLYLPDEEILNVELEAQCVWTRTVQARVAIVSGPVHIAYPPYLAVAPPRVPPLPSPGLMPALLQALGCAGVGLPATPAHHARATGRWTIRVSPWTRLPSEAISEDALEAMRRSFRRGAYRTHVPVPRPAAFAEWMTSNDLEKGLWPESEVEEGTASTVFGFPSYLVTNNEVTALRKLLARHTEPDMAAAHYEAFLFELLKQSRRRRIALDNLAQPAPETRVAETFDAIVRTDIGLLRVSGRTEADDASRSTWSGFREMAEMDGGMIYITRRYGPR